MVLILVIAISLLSLFIGIQYLRISRLVIEKEILSLEKDHLIVTEKILQQKADVYLGHYRVLEKHYCQLYYKNRELRHDLAVAQGDIPAGASLLDPNDKPILPIVI